MKRTLFAGAAVLLAASSSMAFAQDKPVVAGAGLSPNMTGETQAPAAPAARPATPSADIPGTPAEAAFDATGSVTGVSPGTPDGQPSTIPHSTTTETTPAAQPAAGATAEATPAAKPKLGSDSLFTSVTPNDDLTSSVIGLEIYNKQKQDIGTIKDLAFDADGLKAYIVGVGGFLGMGDRYVAILPSALTLSYSEGDKKWHAVMDTNAVALTAAPQFKYPTNS